MSAGRPWEGERGERGGSPLGETPGAAEELRSGDGTAHERGSRWSGGEKELTPRSLPKQVRALGTDVTSPRLLGSTEKGAPSSS